VYDPLITDYDLKIREVQVSQASLANQLDELQSDLSQIVSTHLGLLKIKVYDEKIQNTKKTIQNTDKKLMNIQMRIKKLTENIKKAYPELDMNTINENEKRSEPKKIIKRSQTEIFLIVENLNSENIEKFYEFYNKEKEDYFTFSEYQFISPIFLNHSEDCENENLKKYYEKLSIFEEVDMNNGKNIFNFIDGRITYEDLMNFFDLNYKKEEIQIVKVEEVNDLEEIVEIVQDNILEEN
jgi:hypothetical protein